MKPWTRTAATALALVLPAGGAFAITPEEVWDSWKAGIEASGATLTTTSEARNGADLVITGLKSNFDDPNSGASFRSEIGGMTLTDRGDGTVAVTLTDDYLYEFSEEGAQEGKPTVALQFSQPGAEIIASGEVGAVSYAMKLPEVTVKLVNGHRDDGTPVDVQMTARVTDVNGTYQLTPKGEEGFGLVSDFTSGALTAEFSGSDFSESVDSKTTVKGTVSLSGLKSSTSGEFLASDKMTDLGAAIAAGFTIDSQSEFGAFAMDIDVTEGETARKITAKLDSSDFGFLVDKSKISYGFTFMGGDFSASMPEMGVISALTSFTEATLKASMPSMPSEEAGDFTLLTRLTDLTLSDEIWGLFDPTSQFPRDPATLVIDLSAKGAWLYDIFNPAGPEGLAPGQAPARIDSLNLTEALLKLVGASVDATGALTFDNSDLETFGGFPAPDGKITVNLAGVSVLLDKLVALGLISPDDLSGVRMGLAMFTRPGAGPDQLVTEIEFRNKGLFVNGQQIM